MWGPFVGLWQTSGLHWEMLFFIIATATQGPVGSPQPRDKRKTHRLLLLHEGSFWLWWWSQESAHVIKLHKMEHVHMHNMNTHTSTCKPVETWVRSEECSHDCDVVLQLCEIITLVKSIQNLSLLFLMTESSYLKKEHLCQKKKCGGGGASALVMGWSDLWLLTPPPSSVCRCVHGFRGHVLTRQSEHVINVLCQFLTIWKWFICVFPPPLSFLAEVCLIYWCLQRKEPAFTFPQLRYCVFNFYCVPLTSVLIFIYLLSTVSD